ncbi:hypothetical protein HO133_001970 [Letharia lupina]|uniref:NDT80 domain-containing protein n=1 Tax=Letharia lupina TaxID=560253 RepID=A0A8H6CEJ2_9LECA|nr:uncharacterized protein HO133_001970 [Letharia lupina]KAF6222002.1 hypothetical protein HO133_001970 [Letharia lupina]
MNGYDHMAMPYLPPNNNTTTDDYLTTLPAMGLAEQSFQTPTYSTDDFRSIHSISQMPPLLSSSEADRAFNPVYPDFHYDSPAQQETHEQSAPESASIDRDDELLSFQPITYHFSLLDHSLRRISLSLNARLHGMFFMADPPNAPGLFPQMTPPELTCYRRNLFQVTGSITLPRSLRYILTERNERIPIVAQELTISATESVEGGTVKLISVPWKTPINSPPVPPEEKTEKEPTVIPLDLMSTHDPDVEFATYPFAWKRLQFRIATANNGRRKELQQHFVARLKLVATLSSGNRVVIAEARSAAIIVRGRSPRNFQQRKDLPVGERATGRKATSLPTNVARRTGSDPPKPTSTLKRERSLDNPFASFDFNNIPTAELNSYGGWTRPSGGSNSAPAFPTPTFKTPTLPSSKSPSSASPPLKTHRISHPHPDEPDPKRVRQGPSKSPRMSTSTQPSPQPPYKFSSVPPSLPSTRQLSSTHSPPTTTLPETVHSGDCYCNYFPAATQSWQPPFTTASMNPMYSTPYLPHNNSMTASAMGIASVPGGGANILPNAVTK